jgi:hypothetical protein
MATFNKFESFVEKLAEKEHNLGSDSLKIYLSNATPSASADLVKADLAEITAENGYPAGGTAITVTGSSQSGGVYSLTQSAEVVFTASGGSFGPFRYAVLYNDTHASDALIGWWDYGSSVSCNNGETFTIDLAATVLTIT